MAADTLPGDIVSGLEPSELVEMRRVAPFGSKVPVEGIGVITRRQVKRPLSPEALASFTKVRGKTFMLKGDATQGRKTRTLWGELALQLELSLETDGGEG
ncbi:MAG: hypothetical protein JW793_13665 [Acidobacteria bacterium]|nr:hypothetical protein [Acidobacteriota bacterium]